MNFTNLINSRPLFISHPLQKIPFRREVEIAVKYKGTALADEKYRIDFLIDQKVILEAKAVLDMHPVFTAQILTHMKHAEIKVGLLINFSVERLIDGVKRLINTKT